jgi:hypothetical protein
VLAVAILAVYSLFTAGPLDRLTWLAAALTVIGVLGVYFRQLLFAPPAAGLAALGTLALALASAPGRPRALILCLSAVATMGGWFLVERVVRPTFFPQAIACTRKQTWTTELPVFLEIAALIAIAFGALAFTRRLVLRCWPAR